MNVAIEALQRFAQKKASADEVMRALVSYDGWFAPGGWVTEAFGTNMFERACVWGERSTVPPGHLWLFTDPDGGLRVQARGGSPGFYVGPLRGSTLFEKLPEGITQIEVNPCAPPDSAWFIGGGGVPLARLLGRAIALEQACVTGTGVVDRLLDYDGYLALLTPAKAIVTAVGAGGMKNPGLVFTTPDCCDAVLAGAGGGASSLTQISFTGEELFGRFDTLGIDGLILNVKGPGPRKLLSPEACQGLVQSLRDRAELVRLEAVARAALDAT